MLSSVADQTPEGKSIVELGSKQGVKVEPREMVGMRMVQFTAETRCSGVNMPDGTRIRKGATEAIRKIVTDAGHTFPLEIDEIVQKISANGGTPLVVCTDEQVQGVIELQDIIKTGIQGTF